MKGLSKLTEARYKSGAATTAEALGTGFYVAEAQLWLAEAKDKGGKKR